MSIWYAGVARDRIEFRVLIWLFRLSFLTVSSGRSAEGRDGLLISGSAFHNSSLVMLFNVCIEDRALADRLPRPLPAKAGLGGRSTGSCSEDEDPCGESCEYRLLPIRPGVEFVMVRCGCRLV